MGSIRSLEKYSKELIQSIPSKIKIPPLWKPEPTNPPQIEAFFSDADEVLFGGSAGCGKSDLILGVALSQHRRSVIYRREYPQIQGLVERLNELADKYGKYNKQDKIFRLNDGRLIKFGAVQHLSDVSKHQGIAFSGVFFDELAHFAESQYLFLTGWNRSTDPDQKCQVLCSSNPPTNNEGMWIIRRWSAWLDPKHPNPAKSGEIRWYATIDGKDTELETGDHFEHKGKIIKPRSRTFIRGALKYNVYLASTNYESVLGSLPEPLRTQLLEGDFTASMKDDEWQVIPTKWVEDAIERGKKTPQPTNQQTAIGLDPSRGGNDKTIIAIRYMYWIAPLIALEGSQTIDGELVAGAVINVLRGDPSVYVDVIGIGSSPFDFLRKYNVNAIAINSSVGSSSTDRSGKLGFSNLRSEMIWKLREALDPAYNPDLCLPDDQELLADLTSYRWGLKGWKIYIESKEEIKERIGRSPDRGDAVVYACHESGMTYSPSFTHKK